MKISGKFLSQVIYSRVRKKVDLLSEKGITPTLTIVKTRNTDAINNYINQKIKKGKIYGVQVDILSLSELQLSDKAQLTNLVRQLNNDSSIHGIIFQKPSHPNVDDELIFQIDRTKDVDGFLPRPEHHSPIYRALLLLIQAMFKEQMKRDMHRDEFFALLKTKTIVMVGKGKTGGGLIISGLRSEGFPEERLLIIDTVTSQVQKEEYLKTADIIISAVGKPSILDCQRFPPHSLLVDIGVHFDEFNKIKGDYDENVIKDKVAYYTTTPGGVGMLTVAYLLENTVNAALQLNSIPFSQEFP